MPKVNLLGDTPDTFILEKEIVRDFGRLLQVKDIVAYMGISRDSVEDFLQLYAVPRRMITGKKRSYYHAIDIARALERSRC